MRRGRRGFQRCQSAAAHTTSSPLEMRVGLLFASRQEQCAIQLPRSLAAGVCISIWSLHACNLADFNTKYSCLNSESRMHPSRLPGNQMRQSRLQSRFQSKDNNINVLVVLWTSILQINIHHNDCLVKISKDPTLKTLCSVKLNCHVVSRYYCRVNKDLFK